METYKILTDKERLNLKTFFQLSQPRLNSNVARTAGRFVDMRMYRGGLMTSSSYRDVTSSHHVANK